MCPVTALLSYMVQRGSKHVLLFLPRRVPSYKAAFCELCAGTDNTKYFGHTFQIVAVTTAME